jgi:hypothetical protein
MSEIVKSLLVIYAGGCVGVIFWITSWATVDLIFPDKLR